MRFLLDEQLPPRFVQFFRDRGYEAEHVRDVGHAAATDARLWRLAARKNAILVSKDEDFASLARSSKVGSQVVWVRLGNVSNKGLRQAFEALLPDLIDALMRGERLVEVI